MYLYFVKAETGGRRIIISGRSAANHSHNENEVSDKAERNTLVEFTMSSTPNNVTGTKGANADSMRINTQSSLERLHVKTQRSIERMHVKTQRSMERAMTAAAVATGREQKLTERQEGYVLFCAGPILAAVGGWVNAVIFFQLFLYPGNVTGDVTELGLSLGRGAAANVGVGNSLALFGCSFCFISGAMASGLIINHKSFTLSGKQPCRFFIEVAMIACILKEARTHSSLLPFQLLRSTSFMLSFTHSPHPPDHPFTSHYIIQSPVDDLTLGLEIIAFVLSSIWYENNSAAYFAAFGLGLQNRYAFSSCSFIPSFVLLFLP